MSYSFEMQFKACNDWDEALRAAAECAEVIGHRENVRRLIKESIAYLHFRLGKNTPRPNEVENWVSAISTLRFVFWPEKKLLALVGGAWPGLDKVFAKNIYFQNSTDQDYGLETWQGVSPYFDSVQQRFANMTLDQLLESGLFEDYTREELSESLDYHIQSGAYKQVFNDLCLDDWLYGRNSPAFRRFSMGALQTQEELTDAALYATALLKKGEF